MTWSKLHNLYLKYSTIALMMEGWGAAVWKAGCIIKYAVFIPCILNSE